MAAGYGAEGIAFSGLAAAQDGDLAAAIESLEGLRKEPARFTAIEAWESVLRAAIGAREGRRREAGQLYAEGLAALHRIGSEMHAVVGALDAVEMLGPEDPVGASAAEEIRQFAAANDVPVLLSLLDRRLGRAQATGSAQAPERATAQAGTPQNVRTTS
jgi:hypothetical protein